MPAQPRQTPVPPPTPRTWVARVGTTLANADWTAVERPVADLIARFPALAMSADFCKATCYYTNAKWGLNEKVLKKSVATGDMKEVPLADRALYEREASKYRYTHAILTPEQLEKAAKEPGYDVRQELPTVYEVRVFLVMPTPLPANSQASNQQHLAARVGTYLVRGSKAPRAVASVLTEKDGDPSTDAAFEKAASRALATELGLEVKTNWIRFSDVWFNYGDTRRCIAFMIPALWEIEEELKVHGIVAEEEIEVEEKETIKRPLNDEEKAEFKKMWEQDMATRTKAAERYRQEKETRRVERLQEHYEKIAEEEDKGPQYPAEKSVVLTHKVKKTQRRSFLQPFFMSLNSIQQQTHPAYDLDAVFETRLFGFFLDECFKQEFAPAVLTWLQQNKAKKAAGEQTSEPPPKKMKTEESQFVEVINQEGISPFLYFDNSRTNPGYGITVDLLETILNSMASFTQNEIQGLLGALDYPKSRMWNYKAPFVTYKEEPLPKPEPVAATPAAEGESTKTAADANAAETQNEEKTQEAATAE
eukprot:TRINITY_DN67017_c9_g1_i3.p1 TRINITY_DN67017_c9_g1~~TRINITY_DN67017_c9_g1_i3.p1  ORF type:complete len:534 (+),score=82.05 TRINITY_DN67017_c9_g1_i3:720-2321(+)